MPQDEERERSGTDGPITCHPCWRVTVSHEAVNVELSAWKIMSLVPRQGCLDRLWPMRNPFQKKAQ